MPVSKVLAFMCTRATGQKRLATLKNTIEKARDTAGHPFELQIHVMDETALPTVLDSTPSFVEVIKHGDNVGQHVAFNQALQNANEAGYDYLLRLDDDVEFMTKLWLRKLVEAADKLGPDFAAIAPTVKGLKHPPAKSNVVDVNGVEVRFLEQAIGGVCRLHPVKTLVEGKYMSDVRSPLGFGDATGIAKWARKNKKWMVYLEHVRVKHGTAKQVEEDAEYHEQHAMFQHLPYIPLRGA